MLKIGLTGGIGSGKTAVSNLFEKMGIHIIDTDIISRQLLINDQNVVQSIITDFGKSIVNENNTINRSALANIVFNDATKKKRLEAILHPKIRDEVNSQTININKTIKPNNYIIIVIPLLFETNFNELIDHILVVTASESIRIKRVKTRDNRTTKEIQSIINTQVIDEIRCTQANDVIENNNGFEQLESKVMQLHNQYLKLANTHY
ncbi:MAG: dephospho-CoA kinase [Gammaproteobacteria bacterium]|nr:MAG: dephospho-CoA kinase [Gammaproteobacteria bacterium]